MVSKRKTRRVSKASSETQDQPKPQPVDKPTNAEALTKFNGELIEQLFSSTPWTEIAFPVLQESIAGVSGRYTNGRYWHGTLTSNWKDDNPLFLAGYQKGLMDFYNHLQDFISAKNNLIKKKKEEEATKSSQVYNPFLEELNDGEQT